MQASTVHFIVLSRYRSGSNLLAHGIDAHPRAVAHGELFNLDRLARNPARFIDTRFLDDYWRRDFGYPVVGFKLMYGQATDIELAPAYWGPNLPPRIAGYISRLGDYMARNAIASWQHLEDQLADNDSLRVIHLTRDNAFAGYVSFQLAMRENNWYGRPYESLDAGLRIDIDDVRTWFEYGDNFCDYYNDLFAEHRVLHVTYESLTGEYRETMKQVGEFLALEGLPDRKVRLKKQQTRPLRDVVANYDEVRDCFNGTEWERYFER